MKKTVALVLVVCLLPCCGCMSGNQPEQPLCRVVTQISITREQSNDTVSRKFTDSDSMSAILLYLRKLNSYGKSDSVPSEGTGSCYHIVLDYSDGTQQTYRQIDSNYFQDSSGTWKFIDAQQGDDLQRLFDELPE